MVNGKKVLIVLLVVAVLASVFWLFFNFKDSKEKLITAIAPEVKDVKISVSNIEQTHMDLSAKLTLENKTPIAFNADSAYSTFYIDGHQVAKSRYQATLHINPRDTSNLFIPLKIYQEQLVGLLQSLNRKRRDSVDYTLQMLIYHPHFPDGKVVIKSSSHLPLYKIPDVALVDIKTDRLGFSNASLEASVSFKNNNIFDIDLNNIDYELQFAGEKPLKGRIQERLKLTAQQTTLIKIPLDVKLKALAQSIVELIKQGKHTPYQLKLHATIASKAEMINGGKISLKVDGTVEDFKKLKD